MSLRLSAAGFGHEYLTFHVDEDHDVPAALGLAWDHLHPPDFLYPALLWYVLFAADRLVFWFAHQYGAVASWAEFGDLFARDPIPFFLLGRTVSVAHHSALDVFSPEIPELAAALRRSGALIREFSPYADGMAPHPVYDRVDPDYSPIGGFRGIRRLGPLVELYRLD